MVGRVGENSLGFNVEVLLSPHKERFNVSRMQNLILHTSYQFPGGKELNYQCKCLWCMSIPIGRTQNMLKKKKEKKSPYYPACGDVCIVVIFAWRDFRIVHPKTPFVTLHPITPILILDQNITTIKRHLTT